VKKIIIFLLDKKNTWIEKYILRNKFYEISKKYDLKIKYKININEKAEMLFLLGYTSKFKTSKYKKIKNFFLVHESNLPIGRGWSPVKYQLLANKSKIKCCLISCEDPIDSGDIYETGTLNIDKTDLYDDIKIKQYKVTINLITRLIKKYPNIKSKKQKGKATWYKKLSSDDDKLNFNESISSQFNKIRSTDYHNYQNYFFINNKKFYLRISKKKIIR
jgi:methionyl-tRNA formyltransferase|tara:strand:- start:302 stop:955 length:654 start_codon:yes stop_codon:yes gene_type:complete